MTAETPLRLSTLDSFERQDLDLWNWFCTVFPGVVDARSWTSKVASQLLRQSAEPRARLVKTNLADPAQPAERIVLLGETIEIGRDAANTIVLPEATITRRHAVLRRANGCYAIEDLGSTMGTLSGGARLPSGVPVELGPGSEFVIFPHRFHLEIEREWSTGGEVDIAEPMRTFCGEEDFRNACPVGWNLFPIRVEPLGLHAQMALDGGLVDGLVDRMLAPIERQALGLAASSDAWIELLLLAMLETANKDLVWPFQIALRRRGSAAAANTGRGIVLSTTLRMGSLVGGVCLMLPFSLLEAMKRQSLPRRAATLEQRTSWKFVVTCGSFELTQTEQQMLETGDVVLYQARTALLHPGNDSEGFLASSIDDARLEIRERFDRRTNMTEQLEPLTAFPDLPLRVEILVGERELTLAEARSLAPGSILDLERDPSDPVRLAVNGRVVGVGELVELQGRLGVKILEWRTR